MDTYCNRSFDWYLVDLDRMKWKMCCLTNWNDMSPGDDWFNGTHMRSRRLDHLEGRRHADCNVCWKQEDRGQLSVRNLLPRPAVIPQSLDPYKSTMLEITMGNLCNLACRYCSSVHSSIWAERMADADNKKVGRISNKADDRYTQVLPQFYDWLNDAIYQQHINHVWFTGGEVVLMESFYDLLDRCRFKNMHVGINTNLNIPPAYANRLTKLINQLIADGNTVMLRVSIDGVGAQNDWQRQGSNWDNIEENWYRFGSMDVDIGAAFTVTALTLEGMLDVGKFLVNSADRIYRPPSLYQINNVLWPTPLDPTEWITSFRSDITELNTLIRSSSIRVVEDSITRSFDDWTAREHSLPSVSQATALSAWLDDSAQQWGGGDWRPIYPRIADICNSLIV